MGYQKSDEIANDVLNSYDYSANIPSAIEITDKNSNKHFDCSQPQSKYLREALLEYQKRALPTGCALFSHHQDDEAIIYGVEQAICAGYLQQGGQTGDGILIRKMTILGKEYLKNFASTI